MPADEYHEAYVEGPVGRHLADAPYPDGERDVAHAWLDSDAGPVVRPYAVTGGRAAPVAEGFDLVSFVVATDKMTPSHLLPEHRSILERSNEPVSVAEVASHVDLPLGVVRVLLGDLLADGLISMYSSGPGSQRPDERVLKAVINGLRSL